MMEKRVIVFLVLSLAIIFGYDYALKEMGWLPQPSPAQEASMSPEAGPVSVPGSSDSASPPRHVSLAHS